MNLDEVIYKRITLFFILILVLPSIQKAIAQCPETNPNCNATNNWVFGDSCGIYFGKDTVYNYKTAVEANEGTAILSDTNGDLLFYTDGIKIFNSKHRLLNINLKGYVSSTQTSIINQIDSAIYISTTNPDSGFYIAMFMKDGDSLILIKNSKIIQKCPEGQASINHKNNKSVWLTTNILFADTICFFLLTKNNLICCPIFAKNGSQSNDVMTYQFTENGNLFGIGNTWNQSIDVFEFDSESAKLNRAVNISASLPFSFNFVAKSNTIIVNNFGKTLSSYNISSFDYRSIQNTKKTIFSSEPFITLGAITKNNKNELIVAQYDSNYLGKIKLKNDSIYWLPRGYYLGEDRVSFYGLPNFNASYFYTPSIDFAYTEDCWEHTYSFDGRDTFDADGYKWIFEKSGYRDSILTKHCSYQFPDTGSWQVSHIAWNTNRADTVTKTLTIRPKWSKDVLGKDTFYCRPFDSSQGDDKFKLTLQAPPNMHCVHWNGEEPNLDETLGPIVDYDHFHTDTLQIDTAGTYIVKLTNKTFCQMWDTLVVEEKPRPSKTVVNRLGNLLSCDVVASKYRWYYNGTLQQTTDSNFLDPNQNGYWQVQLVSEFGCESELSDSILVDFASIDPRLQDTRQLNFNIYPNPSDGHISIAVPKKGLYNIQIINFNGKVIYSTKQNLSLFATANELEFELARGTYTLQLTDEDGNVGVKKVVVK